ncbi:Palmitoyltransferase ZDHHC3 [Nymphon striatum]|nr:Palmitoyltransferase ZDHHC3 [Nymphon striatum]
MISFDSLRETEAHNKCWGPFGTWWCVSDICGIICAILTWFLILYAEFVVVAIILWPSSSHWTIASSINLIIFQLLNFLAITSHLRTMLSDPGTVPKGNATKEMIQQLGLKEGQIVFKCPKCCSIKPERAHHCSVCQRCVRKMDHHCPWVNNCVGENNQKYFVLFTFYIAVISIYALILAGNHVYTCVNAEWKETLATMKKQVPVGSDRLFDTELIYSRIIVIQGIEQLKKEQASWKRRSRWKSLRAVFGKFSWAWFSPFHAPSPGSGKSYLYSV